MALTVWERELYTLARGDLPEQLATELREHARRGVDCAEAFAFVLCLVLNVAPRDPWLRRQVIAIRAEEAEAAQSRAEEMVSLFQEAAGWDRPEPPSGPWRKLEHGVDEGDGATWCGQGIGQEAREGMDAGSFLGSRGWVVWTRRPALVTCAACRVAKIAALRLRFARGPIA